MKEDQDYKLADYQVRSSDSYALAKYKVVLNHLPRRDNLRVLNMGCGSGEMNIMLARHNLSWQIDALDIDQAAIDLAQLLKHEYNIENLSIFQQDIDQYTVLEKYDVIVSNDVLEHIKNDIDVLQKLSQLLQPGGKLLLTVPALSWLFGYHDQMLGHYRRYQRQELLAKISRFFSVQQCRYFGLCLIPVVLVYSCWLRQPYPMHAVGKQKDSWLKRLLQFLLDLEVKFPLMAGISLIVSATLEGEKNC